MRTIIAGSRSATVAQVYAALASCPWATQVQTVISGTAQGADRAGERWAFERGIPVERHPADWSTHGRAAGHIRNKAMAAVADALVAVWDGKSPGTRSMIGYAHEQGLKVYVYRTDLAVPGPAPTGHTPSDATSTPNPAVVSVTKR